MEQDGVGEAAATARAPVVLVRVPVAEGAGSRGYQDVSQAAAAASRFINRFAAKSAEVAKPSTIDVAIAGFGLASSLAMLGVGLGGKARLRVSMTSDEELCASPCRERPDLTVLTFLHFDCPSSSIFFIFDSW